MKLTGLFLLLFSLVFTLQAQVPSAINFQGNLTDPGTGNAVSDGAYNMDFALFDANAGGTQLWSESQPGVPVQGGIFNVILGSVNQLDPSVFSQPVWLEITVGGELLDTRIELAATAYSINSANTESYESPYTNIPSVGPAFIAGDTSTQNYQFGPPTIDLAIDDNDTGFDVLGDGDLSFYTNGQERMVLDFVGSLYMGTPISGGAGLKFEINFDDIGTDWGGMYLSNSATTARPYYGYANGSGLSYTYLDGADGNKWKLYNSGDHLTVQPNGNVGIGTTTPADKLSVNGNIASNGVFLGNSFNFNAPVTKYLSIPAAAFILGQTTYNTQVSDNDSDGQVNTHTSVRNIYRTQSAAHYASVGGGDNTVAAYMYAPVYLPQDAVIKTIESLVFESNSTYDVSVSLHSTPFGVQNTGTEEAIATTTGTPGHILISSTGLNIPVDNENNAYYLRFDTRQNTSGSMVIYHVRITYEVSSVD